MVTTATGIRQRGLTTLTRLLSLMLMARVLATLTGVSMLKGGVDIGVVMTLATTSKRHNVRCHRHREVKEHHPK